MGMNVNLTPELETLVRRKVASGLYTSAREVVREALRLMEEQDQMRAVRLEQLRHDVRKGLESGPNEAWDPEAMKQKPPGKVLSAGHVKAGGAVAGACAAASAFRSRWAWASPRCAGPGCCAARRATGVLASRP